MSSRGDLYTYNGLAAREPCSSSQMLLHEGNQDALCLAWGHTGTAVLHSHSRCYCSQPDVIAANLQQRKSRMTRLQRLYYQRHVESYAVFIGSVQTSSNKGHGPIQSVKDTRRTGSELRQLPLPNIKGTLLYQTEDIHMGTRTEPWNMSFAGCVFRRGPWSRRPTEAQVWRLGMGRRSFQNRGLPRGSFQCSSVKDPKNFGRRSRPCP